MQFTLLALPYVYIQAKGISLPTSNVAEPQPAQLVIIPHISLEEGKSSSSDFAKQAAVQKKDSSVSSGRVSVLVYCTKILQVYDVYGVLTYKHSIENA